MKNYSDDISNLVLPMLLALMAVDMLLLVPMASADIGGVFSGIADMGFKFALIRHWKAILGVLLLLGAVYAIAPMRT